MTTLIGSTVASAVQVAPGTVQGGVPGSNLPTGSQMAMPGGGAGTPTQPPAAQTFHVVVTGSGSVSATVQPLSSNDGVNWLDYGSAMAVAAGTAPQQTGANGAGVWAYYSAYVTAISGTGAAVTCTMSA